MDGLETYFACLGSLVLNFLDLAMLFALDKTHRILAKFQQAS